LQDAVISFPMFGDRFHLNPPRSFEIFGRPVYWYAVIIAAGFILATLYILRRRNEFGLTQDNILDIFIYSVPSGIIGARLFYVLFNPTVYFGPGKWMNIFKVWEGGLAIYGGIIVAAIAMIVYSRVKKIPAGVLFDVGGLGLLIGQAIGRWGNFINREAYGSETAAPWRMGLTTAAGTIYVHPTFLYESLWNIIGFVLIHFYTKRRKYDGEIFLLYTGWYGLGRYMIEGLRTDSLYLSGTDIRISQLLAALTFGSSLLILLRNYYKNRMKPSVLYADRIKVGKAEPAETETKDDAQAGRDDSSSEENSIAEETQETKRTDNSSH
jgi:phosphatidylglycerol:prolipoprotein diacylglycerol transferase